MWEYCIAYDPEIEELNKLGKEHWELVAITQQEWENTRKGVTERSRTFYFKRPLFP